MTPPPVFTSRWKSYWPSIALVAIAVLVAYGNSFRGPFVFDDWSSIVENATLRHWRGAWDPPADRGQTVGGRPLVNLTLALNFAAGGLSVTGYHIVNLLIHLGATLALLGLVHRSLGLACWKGRFTDTAWPTATLVALLWAVHPLQTSAVTYVAQRAESLAGLFTLLTLLAFVRAAAKSPGASRAGRRQGWLALSVLCCAAGMASKETAATAPLLVALYDRTFVAGSFRAAWQQRRDYYLALAATWIFLAFLVVQSGVRAGSAGWGSGLDAWRYLCTQTGALLHYLKLVAWPQPLVFDYGNAVVTGLQPVWPQAFAVVLALGATAWALRRRPPAGFLAASFFLLLAPSSSFVPVVTQTIAEHRMYLALAPILVAGALGLAWLPVRWAQSVAALLTLACIWGTHVRNRDYRSAITLWSDTVNKFPSNARAQLNLGVQLAGAGRIDEALARFIAAEQLAPGDSDIQNNLANGLKAAGRTVEALRHYALAVELGPRNGMARLNYGRTLASLGRWPEAREQLVAATGIVADASAESDLGRTYISLGQLYPALITFRRAIALNPQLATARTGLGEALARSGQLVAAEEALRAALLLDPGSAAARNHLGNVFLLTRRPAEAVTQFELALRQSPDSSLTLANLGAALALSGRVPEARQALERALQVDPRNPVAQSLLEQLRGNPAMTR